jgi:hypothetical protein
MNHRIQNWQRFRRPFGWAVLLVLLSIITVNFWPSQGRTVKNFLGAAMAAKDDEARRFLSDELDGRAVLGYDVLGYTVKNKSDDVVAVEVSFRGDKSGYKLERGVMSVDGYGTRREGEARCILRFRVRNGKIDRIF